MMSPRLNGLRPTSSGRTSIVPSPRPVAMTGMPPRSRRAGTMLARSVIEQDAAGEPAGVDDAADQAVGRAHRHADRDAVAGADREDREAPRAARSEEPTMRPVATAARLRSRSCSAAFSCRFSWSDRLGLDHPPQHRCALALELAVLARRVPIIAGAADQPGGGGRDLVAARR